MSTTTMIIPQSPIKKPPSDTNIMNANGPNSFWRTTTSSLIMKSHSFDVVLNANVGNITGRTIGPAAILGGTATIYAAALRHTSTTLTPISALYLLLLALNYSIMPRITKKYLDRRTDKESVALVEEVVKLTMGVAGFYLTHPGGREARAAVLKNWSWESSLLAAGVPSALYAIQGVLTYTAYQNLDSVTFNGLTQMKTLSAALCCFVLLGKMQSRKQLVALGLLSLSTAIFQGTFERKQSQSSSTSTTDGDSNGKSEKASSLARSKTFLFGVVPCLSATLLSGFAGALSQKSLQSVVGSMNRDAYFYSAEISFFSALCLVFSRICRKLAATGGGESADPVPNTTTSTDGESSSKSVVKKSKYFDYWTMETFIPILVKAAGGVLTALVHKHSGSVMKGFALVLGLVFSGVFQTTLDGKDLTLSQVVGTAIVLLSSWLHFTNPVVVA